MANGQDGARHDYRITQLTTNAAMFKYYRCQLLQMWWPIGPIGGGTVFVIVIIALYAANNPEILDGLADAALVRCTIDARLADVLDSVGVNQNDRLILDSLVKGEKVLVGDVRSIDDRIKNLAATSIMWDTICHIADR